MDFGHDTDKSLGMVTDLINSDLDTLAQLDAFVQRHEVSEIEAITDADLRAVRQIQARLRAVFSADSDAGAVELVNALIATSGATPQLANHDGYPVHMHYFAPGASLADHLCADGAMALGFVLAAGERDRLRICEAPSCERVLVDLSRNRCRLYCDAKTCGNRQHVAAYRARRAEPAR